MPIPSQRKYDADNLASIKKHAFQVKKAYLAAINEVSRLTFALSLNPNDEFYFRNYSEVNNKVNDLIKKLYTDVYGTSVSGINTGWETAVEKNNALTNYVYGEVLDKLPAAYRENYLSNNGAARRAFISRKTDGLNLSDRVWKNSRQFKQELELSLELGLGQGKSADSLSRSVRQYLNEPDKLFRKVRDKNGVLRLSKAGKAYSPGRGVYRSSYKNAQRLTRNEINNGYESSQKVKREQQDFIVGIRIAVSPQHRASDDKGGVCCLCLQGLYPKDFDFTYKHHVNCICTSFNVLKTREELDKDTDLILEGKEPNTPSKNSVDKIPKSFTNYFDDNKDKFKNWKTKPMVLTLNQ